MNPSTALRRVVEDDDAPPMSRWEALNKIPKPPLILLRRLLVKSATRTKPVPSRLYALAALLYAKETELRKQKKKWKSAVARQPRRNEADREPDDGTPNALGI